MKITNIFLEICSYEDKSLKNVLLHIVLIIILQELELIHIIDSYNSLPIEKH